MSYSLIQDWDGSRKFTFEVNANSRTWISDSNKDMYRWYHVVGVYDGTNTYIYVDGIQEGFTANSGNLDATANPLYIGRGDQYFDGRIDEVRVLDIDKSAEWILAEFRNQNDPRSFFTVGPEISPPPANFTYAKDITIDNTKVNADLNEFPLLIDIYDTDLKTDVQVDGDDIVFKAGEVSLSHEIVLFDQSFNSTHAHLIAWVKTDLSSTVDTTITMYYGNPEAINQEKPYVVWSNDYVGVWHLGESSGDAIDSTAYGSSGSPLGGVTQGAGGWVDGAYDFDGANGRVSVADPVDGHLDFGASDDFTISLWMYLDTAGNPDFVLAKRPGVSAIDNGYALATSGGNIVVFEVADGSDEYMVRAATDVSIPAWHYVTLVWDDDSISGTTIYMNGVDDKLSTSGTLSNIDGLETTLDLAFGAHTAGIFASDGRLDEIRIASVARSAEWIAAEFANQNDPSSFYSIGLEQIVGEQPPIESEFSYKKDIVVDNTKVSADLTDFPLLVDIYDADLRTDVQPDGDDIIFKIGTVTLPHEIELFDQTYNSTHAHLVAWVKVDLSSSVDTNISMYYGNANMNNQESPSDVWNSNYVAVWHFNQDPSSTNILDSTSNGYHLAALGFGSDSRVYDGRLGTAISVNGINNMFGVSGISGPVNDFTFQSWFKFDNAFPPGSEMHLFRGNSLTNDYPLIRFASSGIIVTHIEVTSDNDDSCTGNKNSWAADSWSQFSFVRSTVAVEAYHYVDGSLDASDNSADNANPHLPWDQLTILSDFSAGNMWGPGAISEFRILSVALPVEWIATEYANQNDPASFYSVGAEEQISVPEEPSEPSLLDASGYKFSTSSTSIV
ncbi:MAG: LamG-like jellyroll fold domain-containing protein, partial [Candidatus Thorarchaeota archaeon]